MTVYEQMVFYPFLNFCIYGESGLKLKKKYKSPYDHHNDHAYKNGFYSLQKAVLMKVVLLIDIFNSLIFFLMGVFKFSFPGKMEI